MIRLLVFLLVILAPVPGRCHDFHASLTVIEPNVDSGELEITLRLFSDDLEQILERRIGKKVVLERPESEPAVFAYIKEHLELSWDNKALDTSWVGMEVEVDTVWVYVACAAKPPRDQLEVQNSIFFDLFDDQVNTVTIKSGKSKKTLVFRPGGKQR